MTAKEAMEKRERRVVRLILMRAKVEELNWHAVSLEWKAQRRYVVALDRLQRAESRAQAGDVAEARRRLGLR